MTNNVTISAKKQLGLLLWLLGMVGVVSLLPALPSILSKLSSEDYHVTIWVIQAASLVQTGVLMAVAVLIGVFLGPQVRLSSPAAEAAVSRRSIIDALRPQIAPGLMGGIIGGVAISVFSLIFLSHLPTEFVAEVRKFSLPLLTRLLYGGISEEVLMRLGLMTFLVWLPYRIIQKRKGEVKAGYFIVAIAISAIVFGLGHLPLARVLAPTMTAGIIAYVVIARMLSSVSWPAFYTGGGDLSQP